MISQYRVKVARVTPILIADAPLLNLQGVHQPYTPRAVIEVETDNGVVGLGETYGDTEYLDALQRFAEQLGDFPLAAPNRLWALAERTITADTVPSEMIDGSPSRWVTGNKSLRKLQAVVVSAFEVAILDALGRCSGLPVHALLGGKVRDRVDYAAYLFYRWAEHPAAAGNDRPGDDWGEALDPDGVVELAHKFIDRHGFQSIKLKGGVFPPDEEAEAMLALRRAFPDLPLRLDPNGVWNVETGVRIANRLRDVLEYLEDPTTGIDGMAEVHRRTEMSLATNMCITTVEEMDRGFTAGSAQVLLCDHHFWGGLRATQQLGAICDAHGVALSRHSNTHLGISLAAMTHGAAAVAGPLRACDTHRPWQSEDIVTEPHEFVDGAVVVSDSPGLGVELDRDALGALHQRWVDMPTVRTRDDVGAMQLVDPSWAAPLGPRW